MTIDVQNIEFTTNSLVQDNRENYVDFTVDTAKVLKSWQQALYAFEWLTPEGRVKPREELSDSDREKYDEVVKILETGKPLEKPILGVGMLENVEIGSGRAVFALMAERGIKTIEVHVRKAHADDFTKFSVE